MSLTFSVGVLYSLIGMSLLTVSEVYNKTHPKEHSTDKRTQEMFEFILQQQEKDTKNKVDSVQEIKEIKDASFSKAEAIVNVSNREKRKSNKDELYKKAIEMHNQGIHRHDIAKELNLGINEVVLVTSIINKH